jgi:hypothetical protein
MKQKKAMSPTKKPPVAANKPNQNPTAYRNMLFREWVSNPVSFKSALFFFPRLNPDADRPTPRAPLKGPGVPES